MFRTDVPSFVVVDVGVTTHHIRLTCRHRLHLDPSRITFHIFYLQGYDKSFYLLVVASVTRLGDLLDFGQLFKAFGNNYFALISHIFRQFL